MKFPVIGGVVFLLSGLAALATVSYFGGTGKPVTTSADPSAATVPAATDTVVFSVPDMSCDVVCTPTVRKTLAAISGVEHVETSLEDHTATILVSDQFDEAQALAALSNAGYPAERITN